MKFGIFKKSYICLLPDEIWRRDWWSWEWRRGSWGWNSFFWRKIRFTLAKRSSRPSIQWTIWRINSNQRVICSEQWWSSFQSMINFCINFIGKLGKIKVSSVCSMRSFAPISKIEKQIKFLIDWWVISEITQITVWEVLIGSSLCFFIIQLWIFYPSNVQIHIDKIWIHIHDKWME